MILEGRKSACDLALAGELGGKKSRGVEHTPLTHCIPKVTEIQREPWISCEESRRCRAVLRLGPEIFTTAAKPLFVEFLKRVSRGECVGVFAMVADPEREKVVRDEVERGDLIPRSLGRLLDDDGLKSGHRELELVVSVIDEILRHGREADAFAVHLDEGTGGMRPYRDTTTHAPRQGEREQRGHQNQCKRPLHGG